MSDLGDVLPERKFDPRHADRLDAPERDAFLPGDVLVTALALPGGETAIDYGAGTGRIALVVAERLRDGGRVVAVDESDAMIARLRERVAETPVIEPLEISCNRVPLPDSSADRVLAVNLLHEVRGEPALAEMRRLLRPNGLLLVADRARARGDERPVGPPDELLYTEEEAVAELAAAGFAVERGGPLPHHFLLLARPRG